jgi:hypothetical protein
MLLLGAGLLGRRDGSIRNRGTGKALQRMRELRFSASDAGVLLGVDGVERVAEAGDVCRGVALAVGLVLVRVRRVGFLRSGGLLAILVSGFDFLNFAA